MTDTEVGFRKLVGVRLQETRAGYARLAVEITQDHLNPVGACHGGAVSAILDSVMGNALDGPLIVGEIERFGVTVECKVNYLASIPVGPVTATAKVISDDGEIALVEAELHRGDGKLAAIALGTFMITYPGRRRQKEYLRVGRRFP